MNDILLKTFEYPRKPFFDSMADSFLLPVQYLFGGRKVSISPCANRNERFFEVRDFENVSEKTWWKIALAIATLIPGLLIGASLKLCNYVFSRDYTSALKIYQNMREEGGLVQEVKSNVNRVVIINQDKDDARVIRCTRQIKERYARSVSFTLLEASGYSPLTETQFSDDTHIYYVRFDEASCKFFDNEGCFSRPAENLLGNGTIENKRLVVLLEPEIHDINGAQKRMQGFLHSESVFARYPMLTMEWVDIRSLS